MLCQICETPLSGRQRETCSKPCRIKLDSIKRRQSGRLRKASMTPEAYARKQETHKRWASRTRAEGKDKVSWACVTCDQEFKVKRYSSAGYWCSQKCRGQWWTIKTPPTITFYFNQCSTCQTTYLTPHQPHKYCSPECKPERNRYTKWISKAQRLKIYERDEWTCQLCHEPVSKDAEYNHDNYDPLYPSLDHIIPRSQGGKDTPPNLRLAHVICNAIRQDQADVNYLQLTINP